MKTTLFNAMLAITMMMCSCEKFTPEEESSKPIPRENNVTLDLSSKDQVKKACKKVSFGFFKDEAKAGIISQTSDDSDFGAIHLSLAAGTYEVVAIGHNGSGTTISSPEKITFTSNKVTDTFYYYGILDVTDGEKTTEENQKKGFYPSTDFSFACCTLRLSLLFYAYCHCTDRCL